MLRQVSLDDKYDLSRKEILVSGSQAVVRLLLMQRELDRRAGLNTAGFVSGYRGSPLGGIDQQLWKAGDKLAASNIVFQPGLNEDLAATACWGSQQTNLLGDGKYDGVFALWYGKGPGVDRTGDVFRHANSFGTSPHGGVLALMGDDHTAESSTIAHQSEFAFIDAMIPILNPAGVQEIIDYGLYGYALSRFAGTWAALKCVKDNIESTASVSVSLDRIRIVYPEIDLPPGGLHIRHELNQLGQEERLHDYKRKAAAAFVQANGLNRIIFSGGCDPKLGIVTIGTSYLDVRQALDDLGIDEERANLLGIRLFKVACSWPFDYQHMADFVRGLHTVIVVEEKRSLLELQLRENLYGTPNRPVIVGKKDERGEILFPVKGSLDPNEIAIAIGERILRVIGYSEEIAAHVTRLRQFQAMLVQAPEIAKRTPYFCSGCPHNTSTRVPEGSIAGAGIGCHLMSIWMDRNTAGFTAMGGEGAQWIGQAPFSKRQHFFQNLGDGTYTHSGSLAIRFAVAAGVNMTYKILYNDAVAMTGGQPAEGGLTVEQIAAQLKAEGVKHIAIVSDEPEKYQGRFRFPEGSTVHHREDLDQVQRHLRDTPGVTVLIYDQTCAAEKRRRRKRGAFPDPDRRVFINELVCEGCGDCGVKSNCVSIQPVETEFGRKRRIDQSSCNKDFSCLDGFCPSFVTVHGARLRKLEGIAGAIDPLDNVPDPDLYPVDKGWGAVIDGIGGTGVVTLGAILAMAAHLERKGVGVIDMAGLAQKGGAVYSNIRIARSPEAVRSIRVSAGEADLVLGADLVVSGSRKVLSTIRHGHTLVLVNTAEVMPGDFTRSPDFSLPTERLKREIVRTAGEEKTFFFDATNAARVLFGNTLSANMFMLGIAYQKGGLPVSAEAIERAIELNGQAVTANIHAFRWGRRAAHLPDEVRALIASAEQQKPLETPSLDDLIARRADFLTQYQDAAYAGRYLAWVERIRRAENAVAPGATAITEAVARSLFKLMAIKDEYEVARLYTDGSFLRQLQREFESYDRLEFHMAPPILARRDADGHLKKRSFGPVMFAMMKVLARLRYIRGTVIDPFSYLEERRKERELLATFEQDLELIETTLAKPDLTSEKTEILLALSEIPMGIKGFGHVKMANMEAAFARRAQLLQDLSGGGAHTLRAAE